jgi:hypothetical protein
MVTQGKFSVQIINAETNVKFQEHVDPMDMKTYVEVEPDVEYYIEVSGTNSMDALVTAEVDKVSVGYCTQLPAHSQGPKRIGCRNAKGDIAAFRFRKTLVERPDDDSDDDGTEKKSSLQKTWTGTVKVKVYVCLLNHENQDSTGGQSWHKGEVGATLGVTPLNQKKGVYSDVGSTLEQNVNWNRRFKYGTMLEEINLMYCSTVGLINFGLLPQPTLAMAADDDTSVRVGKRAKKEKITLDLTEDD